VRLVVWVAGLASAAAHALAVACVAGDAHAGDASQRAVGDAPGAAGYVGGEYHSTPLILSASALAASH
jgi:hypothetical protein